MTHINWQELNEEIAGWSNELGFAAMGVSDTDLGEHGSHLAKWLDRDYHGTMDYMSRHGSMRSHPEKLHPNTHTVISVRIDYLEPDPRR